MSDSSDDEDSNGHGCCEDDCSDEDCSRLPSSPYTEPPRSPLPLFDDDRLHRSSSCNPSLDTQSLVPSQVIRSTLNPYEDIEEPSSP